MNKKKDYKNQMPVLQDDLFTMRQSSDFSAMVEEMFKDDNVKMKTDLSSKQICKLNIIKQIADYYDIPLLRELYNRFIALRVSKNRKGRGEAVSMTQNIYGMKRLEAFEKAVKEGTAK